jgi:Short C-terminal domain
MIVKCSCQHCDGGIEFDAKELSKENSIVPCPHCGLETKLYADENVYNESSSAFVDDKSKSLQERIAAFKAHSEATRPKRGADVKELQESIKKYETTAKIYSLKDELELAGDKIIIRRRGVLNALTAGINGERTILISSLTAIQMKPGGRFSAGYIVFSYASSKPYAGGMFAATEDPDAFFFAQDLNEQVSSFRSKVEKIMRDSKQAPSSSNSSGTLTDELRKLAELKQQGILSQEEFDAAKKKLLA